MSDKDVKIQLILLQEGLGLKAMLLGCEALNAFSEPERLVHGSVMARNISCSERNNEHRLNNLKQEVGRVLDYEYFKYPNRKKKFEIFEK